MIAELERPYILVTDKKISSFQDILPLLEQVVQSNRPILIVADEVEGDALTNIVLNRMTLLALPNISIEASFNSNPKSSVMTCAPVKIAKSSNNGDGDENNIDARVSQIKAQIEETDSDFDREKLQERLAKQRYLLQQLL
jgi:chaperonin GroEL